ncbi:MAG: hypothetical protein PHW54_04795 [Candidatus Omnitrophica bacterium]|nr:hypothetical protein [Candidatus Omnitrophota bacterium]
MKVEIPIAAGYPSRDSWMKHIGIFLLTVLSLFIFGYTYGTDANLDQVIPFVHKISNPALYAQDPYVATLSSFPSLYPNVIAQLGKFFPLPFIHICFYLLVKYMVLLVGFNLAQHIFSRKETSWLACFLLAVSPLVNKCSLLGEDPLIKSIFYQTTLVGPFALLVLLLFMKKKYVASFSMLVLIYYFNGLIANFVLVMLAFASVRQIKSVLRGWIIFILMLLPWLIWYLSITRPGGGFSPSFLMSLRSWYSGHYFPSEWDLPKWENAIVFLVFFSIFLYHGLKYARSARQIEIFISSIAIMWLIAFITGELIYVPRIVLLQFFRSDIFFIAFGLIFAAEYIRKMIETKSLQYTALSGLILIILIEVKEPRFALPVLIVYTLSLLPYRFIYKASVAGFLILCFVLMFRYSFFMEKIVLITLLLGLILIVRAQDRPVASTRIRVVHIIIVSLIVVSYIPVIMYRMETKDFARKAQARQDWEELQRWVKANTPVESIFIVPPYRDGFRVFSQRSPVVEWVDGSAMHWAPSFEKEWTKRLRDMEYKEYGAITSLRFTEVETTVSTEEGEKIIVSHPRAMYAAYIYASMDEAKLVQLSRKYGAGYVVREDDALETFPLIYRNRTFRLYRIADKLK